MPRLFWLLCAALGLFLSACDSTTAEDHVGLAQQQIASGQARDAIIELKNALQKSPDMVDARVLLGHAYLRLGDFASALKEYERASDLGAGAEVTLGLLRSKVRVGRVQEVIGELEKRDALDAELSAVLAEAYFATRDFDKSRAYFERARETPSGKSGLALFAAREGDLEQAQSLMAQATDQAPDRFELWLRRGEMALASDDYTEATQAFEKSTTIAGGEVLGRIGLTQVNIAERDFDTANANIDRVLEAVPDVPIAQYLKSLVAFQRNELAASESALLNVRRVAPEHQPSLYLFGLVKYRQGQFGQAEDSLRRFLARDPDNVSAIKVLASLLFDQKKYDDIVELVGENYPADAQLMAIVGNAYLALGNTSRATDLLQAAVELAPDTASFRNQLALGLIASGEEDRAVAELESAIDIDGDQLQSDYLLATMALKNGDIESAQAAADRLADKESDSPLVANLLGRIAEERGEAVAARQHYEGALSVDATYFPAAANLARIAQANGDPEAAAGYFRTLLEADPESVDAMLALAIREPDRDAAVRLLENALNTNPNSLRARVGLARAYLATNDVSSASAVIDTGLELHSGSLDLLALRGEADLQSGNVRGARQTVEEIQTRVSDQSINPSMLYALGRLHARTGNLTLARKNWQQAAASEGGHPAAELGLARIDMIEGDLELARKRVESLEAELDGVVALERKVLDGDILLREGETNAAAEVFDELAEEGHRIGITRAAAIRARRGDLEGGMKLLRGWLDRRPNDRGVQLLLAGQLLSAKRDDDAVAMYESLLDTENPVVFNNLAWLYMQRGDDRAESIARRAKDIAPNNPEIADTLGWILVESGDAREGLDYLKEAARLRPENPTVLYHLGVAYQRTGDGDSAADALRRALEKGNFDDRAAAEALLQTL